jgi:hypothetical protein
MKPYSTLLFYPERFFWMGASLLGVSSLLSGGVLIYLGFYPPSAPLIEMHKEKVKAPLAPLSFELGLKEPRFELVLPNLEAEFSVSMIPPRPDNKAGVCSLNVRLNKVGAVRKVTLPARVGLCYSNEGDLMFASQESLFWLELSISENQRLEAQIHVEGLERPETRNCYLSLKENPLCSSRDLPPFSPFQSLAEGKWWGRDLFCQKVKGGGACNERIEIGNLSSIEVLSFKKGEWIAYEEGKWKKIAQLEQAKGLSLAHIVSVQEGGVILEGWDEKGYYRFLVSQMPSSSFKVRPEELFTSVRIRSERQISCMLEKQRMILRVGDWVLKGEGRWTVVRSKEDRQALEEGKLVGEIFVFDRIETKQGQKIVQGHLFNLSRSQEVPVILPVQPSKIGAKSDERKAKGRSR